MKKLTELLKERTALAKRLSEVRSLAEQEDRAFDDEENQTLDAGISEVTRIDAEIVNLQNSADRISRLDEIERQTPRSSRSASPSRIQITRDASEWSNIGEFLRAVVSAGTNRGVDSRLFGSVPDLSAAATTYARESVGADGGFAVPEEFAMTIREHISAEDSFLEMTDNNPISGNRFTYPKDESTPWATDGIQAYWDYEAATLTQKKPALTEASIALARLSCLVPATQELLEDAPAMGSYLERKIGERMKWKINDALVNGLGVGAPLGIFKSGALVSVAKEGSQTAATFNAANAVKMFGRMLSSGITNAVWIMHPDVYPQVPLMTIGDQPIWTPPLSGMKGAPSGLLLGRPIILSETCQTLGTQGDVFLVNWKDYLTISKAKGITTESSIHLWFDQGITAFRSIFRLNGMPWYSAAISPKNGSSTRSGFITLDARA